MCTDSNYNPFPSVTIGGPPGLYKIRCPIPSKENADFCVTLISNGITSSATVLVSGTDQPPIIDTTGASTYDDINFLRAQTFIVPVSNTLALQDMWDQITSPQGYVFVRIIGSVATFVTLKWREKILKAIPAPARTVKPEEREQYHYARSQRIQDMVLGKEGEKEEYANKPANLFGIRR